MKIIGNRQNDEQRPSAPAASISMAGTSYFENFSSKQNGVCRFLVPDSRFLSVSFVAILNFSSAGPLGSHCLSTTINLFLLFASCF